MSKTIIVPGRMHSTEKGNVLAGANEVLDDTKGKKQNVINGEVDAELLRIDQTKQDNLTFDNTPTEDSTNPVTSGGVFASEELIRASIEAILILIPSAASELNKLVDTNLLNSSIGTATATFRGTSAAGLTEQEFLAWANGLTHDLNDYVFWQTVDSDGNTLFKRYKWDGTQWLYEYTLNNSSFTAAQWAAIQSGITAALVEKLSALPTAAALEELLAAKQDVLTFDNNPTRGSSNPVKSGGVYTAISDEATARGNEDTRLAGLIGDEETRAKGVEGGLDTRLGAAEGSISGIQQVIPSGATSLNQLVDTNTLATYVAAIVTNMDSTFNITTTDGHITLHVTQVDGIITSVQVQSSDIASAADLTLVTNRVTSVEGGITSLDGRMGIAETNISALQSAYESLTQSDIIIVDGSLPSTGQQQNKIYRQPDQQNNPPQYYSDYMWDGSTWVLMATYNNGIDPEPLYKSRNLVESGGLYPIKNAVSKPQYSAVMSHTDEAGKRVVDGGSIGILASCTIKKYQVVGGKIYAVSGRWGANYVIWIINWFDANQNFISQYLLSGSEYGNTTLKDVEVVAPANAAYLYINEHHSSFPDSVSVREVVSREYIDYEKILQRLGSSTPVNLYTNLTTLPYAEIREGYVRENGTILSSNSYHHFIYPVIKGQHYTVEPHFSNYSRAIACYFIETLPSVGDNYSVLSSFGFSEDGSEKYTVESPVDGYMVVNTRKEAVSSVYIAYHDEGASQYLDNRSLIQMAVGLQEYSTVSEETVIGSGTGYVRPDGTILNSASYKYKKYEVTAGFMYRLISKMENSTVFTPWLIVENGDAPFTVKEVAPDTQEADGSEVWYLTPQTSGILIVNTRSYIDDSNIKLEFVQPLIKNLPSFIREIGGVDFEKLMKVVVNSDDSFYVRTKYNDTNDIIITHWINNNSLVSFGSTYVGSNILPDNQIMKSENLISEHTDSTAPLFRCSQYWHLFAQHGYCIPFIDNTNGLTSEDVGSKWKDQLDREYIVGKVSSSYIYLLPTIYQEDGHDVRDWKSKNWSTAITSLAHVSGATHTTSIPSVSGYSQTQLYPIMQHENRKWLADGKEINGAGTYYCDEFTVSESQIGYDPATIQDFFGNNGSIDLTGALPMARFTYSYGYKGAQCCVNTTINILREVACDSYGAIQQQFFFDKGDYKAMFMIPKAKAQNGVDLDKPFNSPFDASTGYDIFRTTDYLKDVNDPIDRQIGFLQDPNTNNYLIGMAAGLSLVSGDTVKSKRIENLPIGDTNMHYRILSFSPSNTNKFYVAAVNTAPFANDDYYFPAGYFKEINYYVSYFDPAENVGQVYWYKDGSKYVIYCHCQSIQNALAINVPEIMEGLRLSVVEKTDNTDLLTDTIQNGKFFVNYNTADANYIVLEAK